MNNLINYYHVENNYYVEVRNTCRVINRKKYDTSTATLLMYEYVNKTSTENAKMVMLLQKRNGEYFSYIVHFLSFNMDGRYLIDDCEITPLSEDEAKDLVERYAYGDLYIKIFGDVEE